MHELIICIGSLVLMSLYTWGPAVIAFYILLGFFNSTWYIHHFQDELSRMETSKSTIIKAGFYIGGVGWPFNIYYLTFRRDKHLEAIRRQLNDDRPRGIS